MDAEILDVHVASQAGVEQQVPAGVMIVVVNIHAIAIPFPIAAALQVVRRNNPVRIVVEHDATCPEIHPPSDEITSHMLVAAVGIRTSGPDTIAVGVPVRMWVVRIVPTFVFPVVVAIAVIALVFILAFMLPVIVFIVSVLRGCRNSQRPCQSS